MLIDLNMCGICEYICKDCKDKAKEQLCITSRIRRYMYDFGLKMFVFYKNRT